MKYFYLSQIPLTWELWWEPYKTSLYIFPPQTFLLCIFFYNTILWIPNAFQGHLFCLYLQDTNLIPIYNTLLFLFLFVCEGSYRMFLLKKNPLPFRLFGINCWKPLHQLHEPCSLNGRLCYKWQHMAGESEQQDNVAVPRSQL